MKKVNLKPEECFFNICHDNDIGFYAIVVKQGEDIFIYNKDIDRIIPVFFYKLDNDNGNTYGFSSKPEEARDALKRLGFTEDLNLI